MAATSGHCEPCRRGDFITCTRLQITAIDFDGGYEQDMTGPAKGLARIRWDSRWKPLPCSALVGPHSTRSVIAALAAELLAVHGIGA